MQARRVLMALVCGGAMSVGAIAGGQPAKSAPPARDADTAKGSQSGRPSGRTPAASGPIITQTAPRQLTLTARVVLRIQQRDRATNADVQQDFKFDSAALVFPALMASGSHRAAAPIEGVLRVARRDVDPTPELLTGYPAGTQLAKWEFGQAIAGEVELEVRQPVTVFRTSYDEAAAARAAWPQAWPEEAESTFKPQLFIDLGPQGPLDLEPVRKLILRWTGGKDPKSIPPATLAKFLTAEVQKLIQVGGQELNSTRNGETEGLALQGAMATIDRRRGNQFDIACALTLIFRQAGLPARPVIGYEWGRARNDDDVFRRSGRAGYRAWVEFALPDESTPSRIAWVPVDLPAIRRSSSNPQPLDRAWKYFGTHDELNGVVPISFHFMPPLEVVSHGSPAFYGWMVTPAPPAAVVQVLRMDVSSTSRTGDDNRRGGSGTKDEYNRP